MPRGLEVDYVVQTVGDDELPDGRNVVIVEREEGPPLLLINGEPARAWALMRAYEGASEPLEPKALLSLLAV